MAPFSAAFDLATPGWSHHFALLILKATLILLAAFGISVVLQRASASTRHLVWLVALGTILVAPLLIAWSPLEIRVLPAVDATAPATALVTPSRSLDVPGQGVAATIAASAPLPAAQRTSVPPSMQWWHAITTSAGQGVLVLGILWAMGVVLVLGGLASSLLVVRRIVRDARPVDDPEWQTLLVDIADRLELDEAPRLVVARVTHMPFGCGLVTPTIVLPEASSGWSYDRRRAVLLHELAHIRRRDLVAHMLGRLACAAYWFHPLVWMAAKRLRTESERACDDLAVTNGTHAADYAEHLLDIVIAIRADATPITALAMARRKEFEGRMLAILDPELPHTSPGRGRSALLIAGLLLSAGLVAAAAPARRAQPVMLVRTPRPLVAPTQLPSATESTPQPASSPAPASRSATRVSTRQLIAQSRIQHFAQPTPPDSQARDDRPTLLAKVLRTESSSDLRRVAAWGLQDYDQSSVAEEALVAAVQHDGDASVREMAAWALANFDDHRDVVDALAAALHSDTAAQVRATAAWALGQAGSADATDALTAALGDANPDVRTRAAWALGNVEPKEAPQALTTLLRDHDPETRRLGAWALFQIHDASTLPALETALHAEPDKDVQMAELRAIAVMGDRSVDVLRGLLESPDPEIKSMAIRGLAGGDASGPWPWPWPEPRPNP